MNIEIFRDTIQELHEYFQKDKRPSQDVIKLWWENCNYIPDRSMVDVCNKIEEQFDRLPTNIPRAMKSAYAQLGQTRTKGKDDYDKQDDPDFPLELVKEGQRILRGRRENIVQFQLFCDNVGMPKADRERILTAGLRRYRLVRKMDEQGSYFDLYDGDKFIHSGRNARKRGASTGGDLTFSGMEV